MIMTDVTKRIVTGARPICINCDQHYGSRATETETIRLAAGELLKAYTGGKILIQERLHGHWVTYKSVANRISPSGDIVYRDLWDGKTWRGGYEPFCTLRCALDFARKAYRAGYRTRKP